MNCSLAVGQVERVRPLLARRRAVAQPDVAERAAHHHLVVPAPGAVRVEVDGRDAVLLEPCAGRRPGGDRAGRARCGRSSPSRRGPRATRAPSMSRSGARLQRQPVEERRLGDVRGASVPGVAVARRGWAARASARRPRTRPRRSGGTARRRRAADDLADLLRRRPDVGEHDRPAVRCRAERLGRQVDVDAAGERERDDQRRRGEVRGAHERMDAALEVAVAREHGRDDQLVRPRRPRRSARRAGRSCRCTSCSRSRRARSRASRAAP